MAEARYDAVADFYITGFDAIADPASLALLDLLGPPAGLRVLDVACGHGRITRALAGRGAEVTGVDISAALIARAEAAERDQPLGIRYLHADVASGAGLDPAAFDAVTCNFGLSDIDDLDRATGSVAAALRAGGCFVFSILHPCFAGARDVSGSWPATGRYYDEGHWTAGDALSVLRQQVGANHRMLSTYLSTFRRHGLWLDQIREPEPEPEWTQKRPGADRGPVYLAARCVKNPQACKA
ncbi:MAG TPA: class I SAM-dependent methyltransferase [Streptosporangiaceae bacterium]